MQYLVRFWLIVLSTVLGLGSFGYLFLGFLFPAQDALATGSEFRLIVAVLGAGAAGILIWATYISGSPDQPNRNP